ncbi:zinc ribbon domain-containing protein [Candidatus Kaiserbacteria bacterium]|nr:zinc ribbon domain-containing protein [Candidatus Kaiserbacteria bacterium]
MFCSQCGTQLVLNAKFCSKCGLPISEEPSTVGQFSALKQPAATPAQVRDPATLGTKWLKFWNYFSLPVGGVFGLLMSLGLPALGIIMVPLAILQFVVAYGLHHRKLWAWQWNWALVAITYISMLIPTPTPGSHGGTADLVVQFVIKLILGSLIWMWPNYVYWKKRKGLFS